MSNNSWNDDGTLMGANTPHFKSVFCLRRRVHTCSQPQIQFLSHPGWSQMFQVGPKPHVFTCDLYRWRPFVSPAAQRLTPLKLDEISIHWIREQTFVPPWLFHPFSPVLRVLFIVSLPTGGTDNWLFTCYIFCPIKTTMLVYQQLCTPSNRRMFQPNQSTENTNCEASLHDSASGIWKYWSVVYVPSRMNLWRPLLPSSGFSRCNNEQEASFAPALVSVTNVHTYFLQRRGAHCLSGSHYTILVIFNGARERMGRVCHLIHYNLTGLWQWWIRLNAGVRESDITEKIRIDCLILCLFAFSNLSLKVNHTKGRPALKRAAPARVHPGSWSLFSVNKGWMKLSES